MSVASVAQLLENQSGGGGNFTDVVIGPLGSQVLLECDVEDQLLINNDTIATIDWINLNFPLNTASGNYSTKTETNDYIDANYTNNTDLNTNFVSNATIANYSTTTETTNYLDTNYTNNTDLANDYVAVGGLTDYSDKTDTNQYITDNYTNNTDLNTNIVSNATIANYYTILESDNTFLGLNNYLLSTNIFSSLYNNITESLTPNGALEFINVELTNWIGNANSSYIARFQNNVPFTLNCHFSKTENSNTYVNLYYYNVSENTVAQAPCTISILALN